MKPHIQTLGLAALCVAMAGKNHGAFFDKENEFTTITKSLDDAISGQKQISTKLADIEKKADIGAQNAEILGSMTRDVKKALEELEKSKQAHFTLEERFVALKKANLALELERKHSFGTPADAILCSEEKSLRLVAGIMEAIGMKPGAEMQKQMHGLDIKLLGTESSPGANYITPELMDDIYNTLLSYGAYKRFRVLKPSGRDALLPLTTARPVASWVTSEGTGPAVDTTKAGSRGTLRIGEILCHVPVSLRLIEDGSIDAARDLINDMGEAFAFRIDDTLFNAETTDNATYGAFNGIINQASVYTAAAGTTIGATTLADWQGVVASLDPGVIQRGTWEWFIHPIMAMLSLGVVDGNGRSIFSTALDAANAKSIINILGANVNQVGVMPSTNSAAQKIAVVGDPNGAVVGIPRGMEIASSDHAGWTDATRNFRLRGRAGVLVRKAGAFKALKTHA